MKLLFKTILYIIGGWFFTIPTIIIGAIHLTIALTKLVCKIIAFPFNLVYSVVKEVRR